MLIDHPKLNFDFDDVLILMWYLCDIKLNKVKNKGLSRN